MTKLGEVLRQEMAVKQGLTQKEAGEKLGIKPSGVAKIYKVSDMRIGRLKKICRLLKISFNRILKDSDI